MRTYLVLTVLVACVSSVITTLLISTTTSARAAGGTVDVLTDFKVTQAQSTYASVNPGGEVDRFVGCPSKTDIATGGGFELHGLNGASVPSVTSSYAIKKGSTEYWRVHVSVPTLGHPVEVSALIDCLVPEFQTISR